MISLLRQRNFSLLWIAGLVSYAGNWMLFIALPIYVYQLTGSTVAIGTTFIVGTLPRLLLGTVAGVFADRWDRRTTIMIANVLMGLGVLPLMLVHSADTLWIVYLVLLFNATIGTVMGPAENALLPTLVSEEHLVTANSMNALNDSLARLVGPPLGGAIAGLLGIMGVAVGDASTFFFAAAMVALIRVDARPKKEAGEEEVRVEGIWARFWTDWLNGLKVVKRSKLLSSIFGLTAITQVGEGVLSVMIAVFVAQIFGGGPEELGLLFGAQAIGGMIGSFFVGNVVKKVDPTRLLGFSAIVFGFLDLVLVNYPAFYPSIIPAYILIAVVGIPVVGLITSLYTLMQKGAPDEYRGRVFGAWGTTATLASLVGMLIATTFGDALGPVILLNLQGGGYMLAGLMALVLLAGMGRVVKPGAETVAET
ncbi:MAG TPA: MFS transporter [Chloroflexia bacterium]|jgi:MFS family permease